MKKSFLHHYKGFGVVDSDCMVHMLEDDGEYLIIFEDIDSGTSVTNASELLAAGIVNDYDLKPEDCRFFETYRQYDYETFDEIEYKWWPDGNKWLAAEPQWKPANEEKKIFGFE